VFGYLCIRIFRRKNLSDHYLSINEVSLVQPISEGYTEERFEGNLQQKLQVVTRSSAVAEKPAQRDPEEGKVLATGWPLQRALGRRPPYRMQRE